MFRSSVFLLRTSLSIWFIGDSSRCQTPCPKNTNSISVAKGPLQQQTLSRKTFPHRKRVSLKSQSAKGSSDRQNFTDRLSDHDVFALATDIALATDEALATDYQQRQTFCCKIVLLPTHS
uniref:Secreted protein n=1 Tax=Leersia perrieri TaxID=77586 RepID=A0A0D9VIB6_9ORYZ